MVNLAHLNLSNYFIDTKGNIYNKYKRKLKHNNKFIYTLIDDNKRRKNISLKTLYRIVYNKEFCIDQIENLIDEIWKEIQGTKGQYFISNKGRIKSYLRYNAILLRQTVSPKNYKYISIYGIKYKIHRLVAFAFVENDNLEDKKEVHHKDGNTLNNNSYNLEWISTKDHIERHKQNVLSLL